MADDPAIRHSRTKIQIGFVLLAAILAIGLVAFISRPQTPCNQWTERYYAFAREIREARGDPPTTEMIAEFPARSRALEEDRPDDCTIDQERFRTEFGQ